MTRKIFNSALTGALLLLAKPSYPVPLGSDDPLPINIFSGWYQADKISDVQYRYAAIKPKDGYYFTSRPEPGLSDCSVYALSVVNPTLIQLTSTEYLVNQQIDTPAKRTTRIGRVNLTTGEQNILSSSTEEDDNSSFYPLSLQSIDDNDSFKVNGVLPQDKKLVFDGRCRFTSANIRGSGDAFKLATLSGLPAKSTKNPASMILAEGTQYVMTMESGESLKVPEAFETYFNIIKKEGADPKDWTIIKTSGDLTYPLYMSDASLTSAMIAQADNTEKTAGKKRSLPVSPQVYGSLNPITENVLFCDLNSDKGCVQTPPFRPKLNRALEVDPYFEGFNKTLQLYLVSYQNPESSDAGDRCLFFVDFKTDLIEIPDTCKIKLPAFDPYSYGVYWAGISDDQKYLYVVQDSLEQMMYISFNQNGAWSHFMTIDDVALQLQIQKITPRNPQYYIDRISQDQSGELVVSGSVTAAGDSQAKREAFIVNFKNGKSEVGEKQPESYPYLKLRLLKIFQHWGSLSRIN